MESLANHLAGVAQIKKFYATPGAAADGHHLEWRPTL
jgi:hypothetical protein